MRFPGFEGEWGNNEIGEILAIGSGKDYKHLLSGDIPVFGTGGKMTTVNRFLYDGESVFIGRKGTINKPEYYKGKFWTVDTLFYTHSFKNVLPKFVLYLFQNINWLNYNEASGVPSLSKSTIEKIKINAPTVMEQKQICTILSIIDARIETQSKIIDNLQSQIKELTKRVFSRMIKLKDNNDTHFSEWEFKLGNEVFENISNKNHNSDLPILAITQEHGAIPRDLIEYQISVTDKSVKSYKVVEIGDFIISLRSFQGGIEYSNYKGICSPAYIILRAKIEVNNDFYRYYLKTDSYIKYLNEKLEGIRDGKMISYKYFSDISLPYPSLKE